MKTVVTAVLLFASLVSTASAQFTGPTQAGVVSTVAEAKAASFGTYMTLTGKIVAHIRKEYYLFRDETGEIRVEIESEIWQNRKVGPETKVRIRAEVDPGIKGRYLWVESLELVQ